MDLGKEWKPQVGTILYPKTRDNVIIYRGDLVQTEQKQVLYQAKINNPLQEQPVSYPMPNQDTAAETNNYWTVVRQGCYMWPKDYHKHKPEKEGEIFFDSITGKYYRSVISYLPEISEMSSLILEQINVKENWMNLLSPFILSTRLCDLAIPGVHDSGTFSTCEKTTCLAPHIQKFYQISPVHALRWNCTQESSHQEQLVAGFRNLDLRISYVDGEYRFWHHLTGGLVEESLLQIAQFAEYHPKEILFLDFQHFVNYDKNKQQCVTMGQETLSGLLIQILSILGKYLVPRDIDISAHSTVSDVYKTGKNIIAFMMYETDSTLFWPKDALHSDWISASNPDALFLDRSDKLQDYKNNYPDNFTDISGCVTPEDCHRVAALKRVCERDVNLKTKVKTNFPELNENTTESPTFANAFDSLIEMARYGVNTGGISVFTNQEYFDGNSVHYHGINKMYQYWLSRPSLYKPNIIYVDDAVHSSSIVDTAIKANMGMMKRVVSITNQGSHKKTSCLVNNENVHTKYADSFNDMFTTVHYRVRIISDNYEKKWETYFSKILTLTDGQFPPDAVVSLDVKKGSEEKWHALYTRNIQEMIDKNLDLYARGGNEFVYISYQFDLFCDKETPPENGCVSIVHF